MQEGVVRKDLRHNNMMRLQSSQQARQLQTRSGTKNGGGSPIRAAGLHASTSSPNSRHQSVGVHVGAKGNNN